MRAAPSYLAQAPRVEPSPQALLARVLAGFPGGSLVPGGYFGALPAVIRQHLRGNFGPSPQPRHALWLYLDSPLVNQSERPTMAISPRLIVAKTLARWEATLVAGAVHDLMCEDRERQLVGWSPTGSQPIDGYNRDLAFGQRFPNPTPKVFRADVAEVARTDGLRVVSLTLLKPLQLAPEVVFAAKNRSRFIAEVPAIERFLNPRSRTGYATRFEGFFLEGIDPDGKPFVATFSNARGTLEGGQWSADPPFPHG